MVGKGRIITIARRRWHTMPEQIVRKLREADRLLHEGADVAEVALHLEVSEQTYHRWRNQFGGVKADDVRYAMLRGEGHVVSGKEVQPASALASLAWAVRIAVRSAPVLFPVDPEPCDLPWRRVDTEGSTVEPRVRAIAPQAF